LTFDAVAPIDAVFRVQASGGVTEYAVGVSVHNLSAQTWSDFHFSLIPTAAGDGLDFDTPDMDTTPITTVFAANLAHSEDALDWSGTQFFGTTEFYFFRLDVPDTYQTFTLRAIPTIDASPVVPEPGSVALWLIGITFGAGYLRRQRRSK
jgi:hypothetical protein